jgi:hypothetical protein
LREFWRDGVEAGGDTLEECGAFGKTYAVIAIECVIGQLRCAIDLFDSAKRKGRLDLSIRRWVERLHGACGGRHLLCANE